MDEDLFAKFIHSSLKKEKVIIVELCQDLVEYEKYIYSHFFFTYGVVCPAT